MIIIRLEQVILAYLLYRPPPDFLTRAFTAFVCHITRYLDFLNFLPMLYCYLLLAAIQGRHVYFYLLCRLCTLPRQHLRNLQLPCKSGTRKGCSLSEIKWRVGLPSSSPMPLQIWSYKTRMSRSSLLSYLFLCNEIISFCLLTYDFFLIQLLYALIDDYYYHFQWCKIVYFDHFASTYLSRIFRII